MGFAPESGEAVSPGSNSRPVWRFGRMAVCANASPQESSVSIAVRKRVITPQGSSRAFAAWYRIRLDD
jgi:hypothetical protein